MEFKVALAAIVAVPLLKILLVLCAQPVQHRTSQCDDERGQQCNLSAH